LAGALVRGHELVRMDGGQGPIAGPLHTEGSLLHERLPNPQRFGAGETQIATDDQLIVPPVAPFGEDGVERVRVAVDVGDAEESHGHPRTTSEPPPRAGPVRTQVEGCKSGRPFSGGSASRGARARGGREKMLSLAHERGIRGRARRFPSDGPGDGGNAVATCSRPLGTNALGTNALGTNAARCRGWSARAGSREGDGASAVDAVVSLGRCRVPGAASEWSST